MVVSTTQQLSAAMMFIIFEPPRGKTNNVVSEQVRHKPGTEAGKHRSRLET